MEDKVIDKWLKEEAVEKLIKNENLEDIISDNEIENNIVEYWLKEDFKAFKEIEKRFINKALYWYKDVINSIRIIYIKNSRTML